nr:immunoglobulin heavy chain junction region [Macaca mulatta]MOV42351.1 immunoglobulin heavy chain junction region [Macaca mulatta]
CVREGPYEDDHGYFFPLYFEFW